MITKATIKFVSDLDGKRDFYLLYHNEHGMTNLILGHIQQAQKRDTGKGCFDRVLNQLGRKRRCSRHRILKSKLLDNSLFNKEYTEVEA